MIIPLTFITLWFNSAEDKLTIFFLFFFCGGGDVVWRISKQLPWLPSWISELMNYAVLNRHVFPLPPTNFQLNLPFVGVHFGYWNRINSAVLNLHVTPTPPTQVWAQSYLPFWSRLRRFSRCPQWRPSWIPEQNNLSNSECLCYSDASHQVSAQSHCLGGNMV